jgi:hypothetical protein
LSRIGSQELEHHRVWPVRVMTRYSWSRRAPP